MNKSFSLALILLALIFTPAQARKADRPSARMQAEVVEALAETIDARFFDAKRAGEIAGDLKAAHADGRFAEAAGSEEAFAAALDAFLKSYDRHFSVSSGAPEPQENAASDAPAESPLAWYQMFKTSNYGFKRAEILEGNIGYIDLRVFAPTHYAGENARAALRFVGDTQAVIFDLRENRGGNPSMVQFLASHFFDPLDPVVLNTFLSREADYPVELRSLSFAPAGAWPQKPVYILTSQRTASAAESFAYTMQAHGRATVIGETTRGAANPGASFYVGHGFTIFISTETTRHPVTGENWEGKGVTPDVEASSAHALDAALVAVYSGLLQANDIDEAARRKLEWAREVAAATIEPADLSQIDLADYPGDYGIRTVRLENGALVYQRRGNDPIALIPLSKDRFYLEGFGSEYRVQFIRDKKSGAVTSLAFEIDNGERIVNARDTGTPNSDG